MLPARRPRPCTLPPIRNRRRDAAPRNRSSEYAPPKKKIKQRFFWSARELTLALLSIECQTPYVGGVAALYAATERSQSVVIRRAGGAYAKNTDLKPATEENEQNLFETIRTAVAERRRKAGTDGTRRRVRQPAENNRCHENESSTSSRFSPSLLLARSFCAAVSKSIEAQPLSSTDASMSASPLQDGERAWPKVLVSYREPHRGRSLLELMITLVPFLGFWTLAAMAVHHGLWWGMALTVPAAGFLLRLFMIQHDCGHGSFFAHRKADDWTGRAIGVLTFTPYDYWRRAHAAHHASAGNLDERGVGDITTLTVAEYRNLPRSRRLVYRLYRNPVVMFGIGPIWLFLLKQRLPFGMMRSGMEPWVSTMATNLAILVLSFGLIWLVGLGPIILVQLPVVVLAGSAGIWLFYVQHQFEETHWSQRPQWQFQEAALHGSSYYELPSVLRWLTANIGIHHVHHLSSRVPYYRLTEVLRDYPELRGIGRITIMESIRCVKLVLWDERRQRLVSFTEAFQAAKSR